MHFGATQLNTAAARDAAMRRLRRLQTLVVVGGVALAAGFGVLAHAATPPYQKRRAAEVTLASPQHRAARPMRAHRRHHRHHRPRPPAAVTTTQAPVPAPTPAAPAPPPSPPVQIQPPPAAPAPTAQPPVATSGGS